MNSSGGILLDKITVYSVSATGMKKFIEVIALTASLGMVIFEAFQKKESAMQKYLVSNLVVLLLVSFACDSPRNEPKNLVKDVTFLHVPMVCNAAPAIGCGSRAKFVMLDLMKDPAVIEAWLNRQGTVMAAVWRKGTIEEARQQALKTVFNVHEVPIQPVNNEDLMSHSAEFETRDNWYIGEDVDKLSIEEAGVIADRLVTALTLHAKFKNEQDKKSFREDVKRIMENCFLNLKSFDELNEPNEHDAQEQIYLTAIKYIGEKDMPQPHVLRDEYDRLRDESCSEMTGGAACCNKEKHEGT